MAQRRGPLMAVGTVAVVVLALAIGFALVNRSVNVGLPAPSPTTATPTTASPAASTPSTPTASPVPATATPITLPSTALISAPTSGSVWVLVGGTRLFMSTDRGTTWQERTVPQGNVPELQISFVDEQRGWAMSAGSPATPCQSQAVRLWQTQNGAASWTPLAPTGILEGECEEALSFTSPQIGWISSQSPSQRATIFQTRDGGTTWSATAAIPDPQPAPGGAGRSLHAGRVRAFGTAAFVDAVDTGSTPARRHVYAFQSNGQGFNYMATVPNAEDAFAFAGGPGGGDLRWLLIRPGGTSQETRDSGGSWHPFATDYQQAAPVAPVITFADASIGYATVRGSLQRTTDGGAHWTKLDTPGTR